MKVFIVLFAIFAAASALPGYAYHDPWKSSQSYHNPWAQASSGWNPWQSAWNPWKSNYHHEPEHHHVIQVPQQHPIPPLHPQPLHLKVHSQAHQFHYGQAHAGHPHLIGYEVYHEPKAEIKPVHGHGHGW